ncbi:hypothetical protein ACVPOS_08065 [Staphylococcus aureus]
MADRTIKKLKQDAFAATASIVFVRYLLIIHYFVSLDNATAKALLNLTNQNTSDKAIDYILNSFRFTGIMYILAYLAGFITFWNRHTYVWWFMFAVYVSNSLFTLINLSITIQAIKAAHGAYLTLPILIVIIGSVALAIYMLVVVSIKRKSTFNR